MMIKASSFPGNVSKNFSRITEFILFGGNSPAGVAGKFHRLQFTFADMISRDIVLTAIIAMDGMIGRIA